MPTASAATISNVETAKHAENLKETSKRLVLVEVFADCLNPKAVGACEHLSSDGKEG